MQIVQNPLFPLGRPCAVALGNFDGFHRAHAALLSATLCKAKAHGIECAALSFSHTRQKGLRLSTEEEKQALLEEAGCEVLYSYDFSLLCDYSPERFVEEILLDTLGVKAVFCGFNYRFGKERAGDVETLKALLNDRAELHVLPPMKSEDGTLISSSAIRSLYLSGDIQTAETLLGHPLSERLTR